MPGAVVYREGSDESLTVASAEAVADGPGWRMRFREISSREAADTLRGAYLEMGVRPDADLARGEVYWHEVLGVAVRGLDATELGVVKDIYRVAENEVYVVSGEAFGTFDLPAVRAFIRIFAPRRGEIVVDADALGLEPPRQRRADPDRPRAPRRTSRKGPVQAVVGRDGPNVDGSAASEASDRAGADTDAEPIGGADAAEPADPAEPPA